MVRKVSLYVHIHFIHTTISLLTLDQKKHDDYENCIYALKIHFFVFYGYKDKARI